MHACTWAAMLARRLAATAVALTSLACMPVAALAQPVDTSPAASQAAASQATAAATPPPASVFFRKPDLATASLSPSGRWLAVRVNGGGQVNRYALAVFDATGVVPPKVVAYYRDNDIGAFHCVNDERLVFDMEDLERGSGDQLHSPGLFSVSRDGTPGRQLIATSNHFITESRGGGSWRPLSNYHVLLHVPTAGGASGDDVVVGEYIVDNVGEITALVPKLLNIATGRVSSLGRGMPAGATGWLFDTAGYPRVAVVARNGRVAVHWRADPRNESRDAWAELSNTEAYNATWAPRALDAAGRLYVAVASNQQGRAGEQEVRRFDFATGKPEPQALVSTPGFDFTGSLVFSEEVGGRLIGVRTVTDAESTAWLDARLKLLQDEVDRRLPGRVNRLSCRRCTEPDWTVLVRSYSDRHPGEYWLWRGEPAAPSLWRRVGLQRGDVEPARMATVSFERFVARDGRSIPVWVTTPAVLPQGARPPAVVLAHGGPWVRGGDWEWQPMAQFLASRGYVVIAPEFRGSAGYGDGHFRAGWKQWGGAMQDDLTDAVAWASGKQLVDAKRVCIAGASYGGYATLMSLARHPGVYRCGAAWVAVAEPALLFKWGWTSDSSEESRSFHLPQLIGDPDVDAQLLRDASPVLQAARIKAPVLLAYGENDRRVPIEHGERMRAAMRKAGQDPQWVVYPGEGHSWQLTSTQLDFARRLEQFLADNLR